jgi:hypothetical protein
VLKFRFKASTGTQIKKLMTNELNMAVIKIKQQLGIQPTDTAIDDLIADGTYYNTLITLQIFCIHMDEHIFTINYSC